MGRLTESLKHAFSIEKPGAIEPSDAQCNVVDRVCGEIVRRRMSTPALLFLEMSRPLNYVGAQLMHFFQPIVAVVLNTKGYEEFASFLEHRGSIEYLCRRIEYFEDERMRGATRQAESDASGDLDEQEQ